MSLSHPRFNQPFHSLAECVVHAIHQRKKIHRSLPAPSPVVIRSTPRVKSTRLWLSLPPSLPPSPQVGMVPAGCQPPKVPQHSDPLTRQQQQNPEKGLFVCCPAHQHKSTISHPPLSFTLSLTPRTCKAGFFLCTACVLCLHSPKRTTNKSGRSKPRLH